MTASRCVSGTDPNQLQLDIGDDGTADDTFGLGTFATIVVDAGGGDDFVRLDTANGGFTTTKPTLVDGGKGDDSLIGGSGNELFFGGRGNDFVDGNGGADTAFLGEATTPSCGTRAMARTASRVKAASTPTSSTGPGATRSWLPPQRRTRHVHPDLGGIVMDLNGIEALDVRALGGTDSVTINDLTGTDLTRSTSTSPPPSVAPTATTRPTR